MSNLVKQGTFRFPVDFFKKVLLDYADWKFAFIRECLQNSIDAKSNKISINFYKDQDDFVHCKIEDNGVGMTQEVLEKYYLSMGASNKAGSGEQTGGFGVASLLITQPHRRFVIKSFDYICSGSNGEYVIESSNEPMQNGVVLDITFDKEQLTGFYSMESCVTRWAKNANVKSVELLLNGEVIDIDGAEFDYKCKSELGDISFSDTTDSWASSIFVRINNQPMFKVSISNKTDGVSFSGVLDLKGSSLEFLTSNRDGLKSEHTEKLYKLINELANERTKYKIQGDIHFVMNQRSVPAQAQSIAEGSVLESRAVAFSTAREKLVAAEAAQAVEAEGFERDGNSVVAGVFDCEKAAYDKSCDRISKLLGKISSDGYPESFCLSFSDGVDGLAKYKGVINQKRALKLALNLQSYTKRIVSVIIQNRTGLYFLRSLQIENDTISFEGKPVTFGFVFNDNVLAVLDSKEHGFELKINPLKVFDSSDFDKQDLIELVVHELTHLVHSGHYEEFDSLNSKLRRIVRKHTALKDFE